MKNNPNPIPKELKKHLLQNMPAGIVDGLAEYIHDAWWEEKIAQGYHHPTEEHLEFDPKKPTRCCEKCHLDMIPYAQLPDLSKVFDKVTIETTLAGLRLLGYQILPDPKKVKYDFDNWKKNPEK